MKRWLTFGYYSLFNATDPHPIDPNVWAEDVKNSNFTGISVHLDNPFDKQKGIVKPNDWMYPYSDHRFRYGMINPLWTAKLDNFIDAFMSRGLDVELCLVSQFMADVVPHPFGMWDDDQLYSSIQMSNPVTFQHISWTDVNEPKNQFIFHFNSKMASALNLYMDAVVDAIVKGLTNHKAGRIGYKWANETRGGDKKVGDRSEMNALMHDKLAAKGWNPKDNPRLKCFVDREYLSRDTAHLTENRISLHDSIVRPYGVNWGLGAIHEIHKMCNRQAIMARIAEKSASPANTLFSNDGLACTKEFPEGVRDMIKMSLDGTIPYMDIKMEEGWTPYPNYIPGQINTSWKRYAKLHLDLAG